MGRRIRNGSRHLDELTRIIGELEPDDLIDNIILQHDEMEVGHCFINDDAEAFFEICFMIVNSLPDEVLLRGLYISMSGGDQLNLAYPRSDNISLIKNKIESNRTTCEGYTNRGKAIFIMAFSHFGGNERIPHTDTEFYQWSDEQVDQLLAAGWRPRRDRKKLNGIDFFPPEELIDSIIPHVWNW